MRDFNFQFYYWMLKISSQNLHCDIHRHRRQSIEFHIMMALKLESSACSMCQIVLISLLFVRNFANVCCSQDCDIRWVFFGDFSYKVFQNKRMTFDEARRYCATFTHRNLQSHLASIHNLEEHKFVVDLCKQATSNGTFHHVHDNGCWIGLNDQMTNGVYRWTDGSKVDYYRWGPGQPNSLYGEQRCVINTSKKVTQLVFMRL